MSNDKGGAEGQWWGGHSSTSLWCEAPDSKAHCFPTYCQVPLFLILFSASLSRSRDFHKFKTSCKHTPVNGSWIQKNKSHQVIRIVQDTHTISLLSYTWAKPPRCLCVTTSKLIATNWRSTLGPSQVEMKSRRWSRGPLRQNNPKTSTDLPTKWQCQGKTNRTSVPEYAYRMSSDDYDIISIRWFAG